MFSFFVTLLSWGFPVFPRVNINPAVPQESPRNQAHAAMLQQRVENPHFPFDNAADFRLAQIILEAAMTEKSTKSLLDFLHDIQCDPVTLTSAKDIEHLLEQVPLEVQSGPLLTTASSPNPNPDHAS